MMEKTYKQAVRALMELQSSVDLNLSSKIDAMYAWSLPHIVFGSVLPDALYAAHQNDHLEKERVDNLFRQSFVFIETLATSPDFETRCLVEASFLENILGEKVRRRIFEPYMLSETKKMADSVLRRWGHPVV